MKEIHYRAYLKEQKVMVDVQAIDFVDDTITVEVNGDTKIIDFVEVDIMPYTGLRDRNGKLIYEKDMVDIDYDYAQPKQTEVFFENGTFFLCGEDLATGGDMLIGNMAHVVTVIGNIYEGVAKHD